jgi:hypothetical protein
VRSQLQRWLQRRLHSTMRGLHIWLRELFSRHICVQHWPTGRLPSQLLESVRYRRSSLHISLRELFSRHICVQNWPTGRLPSRLLRSVR